MRTTRYSIVVRGKVDPATLARIGDPDAHGHDGLTELVCDVVDQSQLVGMLSGLSAADIEIVRAAPVDS